VVEFTQLIWVLTTKDNGDLKTRRATWWQGRLDSTFAPPLTTSSCLSMDTIKLSWPLLLTWTLEW
jgi:hypothetical protein